MNETCCEPVYRGTWAIGHPCSKTASVIREGKAYCSIHDPVKVAEKRAARDAVWAQRLGERKARSEASRSLIERLGCGSLAFDAKGPTGGVTLTKEEAEELLRRMGRDG